MADKAAAVKAATYEAFVKGGMSPADAQHFVDTMPQQLIDQATREGGEADKDEGGEGVEGQRVTVWSITLIDKDGGKYKVCDAEGNSKSANVVSRGTTAHIIKLEGATTLALSWNGSVQFEILIRGRCSCDGIGAGEIHIDLNDEVPMVAEDLDGGVLDDACMRAAEVKIKVGGDWTDDAAQEALAPLFSII